MADISELQVELETLVKEVPAFKDSGFSSFDIEDVSTQTTLQTFPFAGVMYNGAVAIDKSGGGNVVVPVSELSHAAMLLVLQYTVVIAIQYHYGGQNDTKPQAMALLTGIRDKVNGYRGVNTRPWRFIGEKPEPEASGDGIAFYSQVWQTVVSSVGTFNNS